MRNERLVTSCAGELQDLREGLQQNWSEQRIRQDQFENRVSALELKTLAQNDDSFSEGDSLNVTRAELAAMGADNVTSRRGRLSSEIRRMTQGLAEKQEGTEETLSQLDERVSEQESQVVESRLKNLAVREKMNEFMQLTAELGEEVSKLKVELTSGFR